jgi:hypothetical protein
MKTLFPLVLIVLCAFDNFTCCTKKKIVVDAGEDNLGGEKKEDVVEKTLVN